MKKEKKNIKEATAKALSKTNVRKSFPLIEGKTKTNIKKYTGIGKQALPPPPLKTIKGNVS